MKHERKKFSAGDNQCTVNTSQGRRCNGKSGLSTASRTCSVTWSVSSIAKGDFGKNTGIMNQINDSGNFQYPANSSGFVD